MKSVLISIQPKWCEKIASGEKTIEVRKSRPKLETPFKVYIYCTFPKKPVYTLWLNRGTENRFLADGKVIGEFVCDRIAGEGETIRGNACLTIEELQDYCNGKDIYFWHITDLKIYDKPKELSEFKHECNGNCVDSKRNIVCRKIKEKRADIWINCDRVLPITRPPQSWCYVEELQNG